jgi:hypothetical protein
MHARFTRFPRVARRALATVAATGGAGLMGGCDAFFKTDVTNPNAVVEERLADPAAATALANGVGASLTRSITAIWGPYGVASDELSWIGSREFWGALDAGDLTDPLNEYTDAAYPLLSETRYLAEFAIAQLEALDKTSALRNRVDLARAYLYAGVTYALIAHMYDDFVLGTDRLSETAPVGEANMVRLFDTAVQHLDKGLAVAQATSNVELQRQILGARAKAKYQKALWQKLKPARTRPADPLINDAGAVADARAALATMPSDYRWRLTPVANNLAALNIGFEMNQRLEIRAGNAYINPDPPANTRPRAGIAGIRLNDPVTGQPDPTLARAIDECCRQSVAEYVAFTLVSAREMHLILAEAALAAGNTADFVSRINEVRTTAGLPAYNGTSPAPREMLIHSRRVNLFLQGYRLHDLYRFGERADNWIATSIASRKACFFPIANIERQSNRSAPQPAQARPAYCT